MKLLAMGIVAFLVLPLSLSYSIDDMSLEWDGHTIETISPAKSLPGTILRMSLSRDFEECWGNYSDDVCALLVDSPQMGINRLRIDVRNSCSRSNSTIECKSLPFEFSTANDTITIEYLWQAGPNRGEPAITTIPIRLDETQPHVKEIQTGFCDGDVCYAAAGVPTPVRVEMEDSVTSFEYLLVFLGTSQAFGRVTQCEGRTCSGEITIPCTDGQRFEIDVRTAAGITSREDAQNDVLPGAQQVICSDKAPDILSWEEHSDGLVGLPTKGSTLTYTARVRTALGSASGEVNTTGLLGNVSQVVNADCRPASDSPESQICSWQLSGLVPGRYDLDFYINDPIGNYRVKPVSVTVLDLGQPEGNASIDFFTAQITKVTPERLNRVALEVARANGKPWPMYAEYEIRQKQPGPRIVSQRLDQCVYKLPGEKDYALDYNLFALGSSAGNRAETHVMNPNADWNESNRLDMQIRATRDVLVLSDEFLVRCQIALFIVDDGILYEQPELENLSFAIGLRASPLGEPGQNVVEKIQGKQDTLTGSTAEYIRKLEEWRQTADKVCKGVETLVEIYNAGAVLQAAGAGLCSSGPLAIVGKPVNLIGDTIFKPLDKILKRAWNGASDLGGPPSVVENSVIKTTQLLASNNALIAQGGWLRQICRQVNCRVTADLQSAQGDGAPSAVKVGSGSDLAVLTGNQYDDPSQWGTWDSKDVGIQDYVSEEAKANLFAADPERSLTGAISSACIGGVIYNLQKYQAIDCGYLQCLKDQSYYGHSVNVCDNAYDHRMCQQVVGEVMELSWIRVWKNLMNNVNAILQNLPQTFASFALNDACNQYYGHWADGTQSGANCYDWTMVGCRVGSTALDTISVQSDTSQALGGLRHPDQAKEALRVCEQAIEANASQSEPYLPSIANTDEIETRNYLRDARGRSLQTEQSKFVEDMNRYWEQQGKDVESYGVSEDTFTVNFADGESKNLAIHSRSNNENEIIGTGIGNNKQQYVVVEYEQTSRGLIDTAKDALELIDVSTDTRISRDVGPTRVSADPADLVKDGKGKTETKQARIWLPNDPVAGYDDVAEMMGDGKFIDLVKEGYYPVSRDQANDMYIAYTLSRANAEDWETYRDLQMQVKGYEGRENQLLRELRAAEEEDIATAEQKEEIERKKEELRSLQEEKEALAQQLHEEVSKQDLETARSPGIRIPEPELSGNPATPSTLEAQKNFVSDELLQAREEYRALLTQHPELEGQTGSNYPPREEQRSLDAKIERLEKEERLIGLKLEKTRGADVDSQIAELENELSKDPNYGRELENAISSEEQRITEAVQEAERVAQRQEAAMKEAQTAEAQARAAVEDIRADIEALNDRETPDAIEAFIAANTDDYPLLADIPEDLSTEEKAALTAEIIRHEEVVAQAAHEKAQNELKEQIRILEESDAVQASLIGIFYTDLRATQERLATQLNDCAENECLDTRQQLEEANEELRAMERQNPGLVEMGRLLQNVEESAQQIENDGNEIIEELTDCAACDLSSVRIEEREDGTPVIIYVEEGEEKVREITEEQANMITNAQIQPDLLRRAAEGDFDAQAELALLLGTETGEDRVELQEYYEANRAFAEAIGLVADYAFKWAADEYMEDIFKILTWYEDVPIISELVAGTDSQVLEDAIAFSLCEDNFDLQDNDDGAVYQPSQVGTPNPIATFGSEVREINDETGTFYAYITVAHVYNPKGSGQDFELEIFLHDNDAENEENSRFSLTNGITFTLEEGTAFGNGNFARTRIDHLEKEYELICLSFDKAFPGPGGKTIYCRTIAEEVFDADSPIPPKTTSDTQDSQASGGATSPVVGWS